MNIKIWVSVILISVVSIRVGLTQDAFSSRTLNEGERDLLKFTQEVDLRYADFAENYIKNLNHDIFTYYFYFFKDDGYDTYVRRNENSFQLRSRGDVFNLTYILSDKCCQVEFDCLVIAGIMSYRILIYKDHVDCYSLPRSASISSYSDSTDIETLIKFEFEDKRNIGFLSCVDMDTIPCAPYTYLNENQIYYNEVGQALLTNRIIIEVKARHARPFHDPHFYCKGLRLLCFDINDSLKLPKKYLEICKEECRKLGVDSKLVHDDFITSKGVKLGMTLDEVVARCHSGYSLKQLDDGGLEISYLYNRCLGYDFSSYRVKATYYFRNRVLVAMDVTGIDWEKYTLKQLKMEGYSEKKTIKQDYFKDPPSIYVLERMQFKPICE